MKDPIFSGRDVTEALALASRSLGVPSDRLRYVVLSPGAPGGLGLGATPAQIAILLEASPSPSASSPEPVSEEDDTEPAPAIEGVLRALRSAAHLDLHFEVREEEGLVHVGLSGPDTTFFLEPEVLPALEHLLHRIVAPQRVRVECPGYREHREESLRAEAERIASEVRADGKPRTTEPLNPYERRIIHIAVSEMPGLRTESIGEEGARRVRIALTQLEVE